MKLTLEGRAARRRSERLPTSTLSTLERTWKYSQFNLAIFLGNGLIMAVTRDEWIWHKKVW
jgi:hypothetical protein